jgi:hypothetical protein
MKTRANRPDGGFQVCCDADVVKEGYPVVSEEGYPVVSGTSESRIRPEGLSCLNSRVNSRSVLRGSRMFARVVQADFGGN